MHHLLGTIRWHFLEMLFPGITHDPFSITESCLVAVAVLLAFAFPAPIRRISYPFQRICMALSRRRGAAVITVGVLTLLTRIAMSPLLPMREPQIHDEFSYLLSADTFLSGRLANPIHPMRAHLETAHVNQEPTYSSMYPPGQGSVLAAGKLLAGHPLYGQWVATALLCALICWALQGWVPPRWALLGGLIALMRLGVFSYWANSYFGGSPGAVGGALLIGALPRLLSRPRISHSLAMGAGIVVMMNTRPFEGFLISVGAFIALSLKFFRERLRAELRIARVLLPMLILLSLGGAATAYYNWRANASPWRWGHQVNFQKHGLALILGQSTTPQVIPEQQILRCYYESQKKYYAGPLASPLAYFKSRVRVFGEAWGFFVGPVLSIPLFGIVLTIRDRRMRLAWLLFGIFSISLFVNIHIIPTYYAVVTPLIYLFLIQSMRHLHVIERRAMRRGCPFLRAILVVCALMFILRALAQPLHMPLQEQDYGPTWYYTGPGNVQRAAVLKSLRQTEGQHLALVRYAPDHNCYDEWVYNNADIDSSKVVWAHDMGAQRNRELLEYFRNRKVWVVEPDQTSPRLSVYSPGK